jgi:hypothetical protein
MGGRTDSDGRLDLDELGSVIESADVAPSAETLEDGIGRPTVADLMETAGLTPWLRRHRLLTGALCSAAAFGLVAVAVHIATMPPPFDPTVVATITPVSTPDSTISLDGPDGDIGAGWFQIDGVPDGERVVVTGIRGPGLGATDGSEQLGGYFGAIPVQGAPVWSARAVIDCHDGALQPSDDDYRLTLRKTDRWGRTSDVAVPLPVGSTRWAEVVAGVCWQRTTIDSLAITELSTRTDLARAQVSLGIRLESSLPVDAVVGTQLEELASVRVGQTFRSTISSRRTVDTEVLLSVLSCRDASAPQPLFPQSASYRVVSPEPGLGFALQSTNAQQIAYVPVRFTPEQTRDVDGAIAEICADAPPVTVAALGTPQVNALGGAFSEQEMRLQLDVRRPIDRLAHVEIPGDPGLSTVYYSVADLDAGRAGPAALIWRFTCQNTPVPPMVTVTVTDGRRSWPMRTALTDTSMERAVLRACPSQSAMSLAAMGWPALLQVRG